MIGEFREDLNEILKISETLSLVLKGDHARSFQQNLLIIQELHKEPLNHTGVMTLWTSSNPYIGRCIVLLLITIFSVRLEDFLKLNKMRNTTMHPENGFVND